MKVYVNFPNESWIVDRFVKEWNEDNADISTTNLYDSSIIWLMADWCWKQVPMHVLSSRPVLTTVHHIVPDKFGVHERADFAARDQITTAYHVFNQHTFDQVKSLTTKPIHFVPYWCNANIWKKTGDRFELRRKHNLPEDAYIVSSFQRDTEGAGIPNGIFLPKLEKGPDLLADYIIDYLYHAHQNIHVVLAGWRRQYVIQRLKNAQVPFSYFELPMQNVVNELYQASDLYPVTARQEGGPQSLLECGLLGVPVVSRPIGIAEQVLPVSAINNDVSLATPAIPDVERLKSPEGYQPYIELLKSL